MNYNNVLSSGAGMAVVGSWAIKKLFKKELLPVSTFKQAAMTYVVIVVSNLSANAIHNEIEKRNITPKP